MKSISLMPVGADDGHDSIKTCTGYNTKTKTYTCSFIKSQAFLGLHQIMSMNKESAAAYTTDGEDFTVAGDSALGKPLDTRFLQYPTSNLNRILVNHALISAGLGDKNVFLVTGLPVDQYYKLGQPNISLIGDKKDSLMKPVTNFNKKFSTANILGNEVFSEGLAAFFDAMFNGDGTVNDEIQQLINRRPITVVDLGGKTLDIATIHEGASGVYADRSGTDPVGVISMKIKAIEMIKSHFTLNNDPPMNYVDEAFISKEYEFFGKSVNISDIIDKSCRSYIEEIKNVFHKRCGDGSDLGAVIFVGGGTALLKLALGEEIFSEIFSGRIIIPNDPEFANARGMWKAASFLFPEALVIDQITSA